MTEAEMQAFERDLERRLRAHASVPIRPFDADAIASEVVASGGWSRGVIGTAWRAAVPRTLAWLAVALLVLAGVVGGLVAGSLLQRADPLGGAPMVLATERGLFLADATGRERTLLRDDGMFLAPRWSPSGDRIAVLHGREIPPQAGEPGAPRPTGTSFLLDPSELLVLDLSGSILLTVPGPIREMAWGPPGDDGRDVLAVAMVDGRVLVVDAMGRTRAQVSRPALGESIDLQALSPPGLAWTTGGDLLFASGSRVMALPRAASGVVREPVVVLDAAGDRVNGIGVAPDGATLAYVRAACLSACPGDVEVVALESSPAGPRAAGEPALVRTGVLASVRVDWEPGGALLVGPSIVAVDGGDRTVTGDRIVTERDTVPGWVRWATDGSGGVLGMSEYSIYNDRHFEAWVVAPGGSARLVETRSLGLDLRPVQR